MAKRTFAVIGLGRFGAAMATTLSQLGHEVIGIDGSEDRVTALADQVSQTVKLDYLIELLEKALGRKAILDRQPPQPGDVPITFANIARARARLGYDPKVKIEEGIPKFVEWFQNK